MSEHAVYSPSGAKKWMTCPGSIAMEHGEPNEGSKYSDEGTAAHGLAAMCLSKDDHPAGYLGRVLHVVDGVYVADFNGEMNLPEGKDDGRLIDFKHYPDATVRTFEVDADMVAHVNTYIQHVKQYSEHGDLLVEERVPIDKITGEEGACGTADAIVFVGEDDTLELQVHDLKYGMGVKVDAANNPQGMMYLLGALDKYELAYGTPVRYRFVIHQPRLDHLDEWDCTHDELMAFKEEAMARAADARIAFEHRATWQGERAIIKGNSYLVPGEHCKSSFCRARATCPGLAKMVQDVVGADFELLSANVSSDQIFTQDKKIIPTDLAALGLKNAAVDLILDWCKQVRGRVEAALFENHNSAEAQAALGFKLVQGKKGNRAWSDKEAIEALLKKMRLKTEEIYDLSVKSPTSIETELKKPHPKQWAKVLPLIEQKAGQPSVAPLTDKREPLVLTPTGDDFTDLEGSDLV